MIEALKNTPIKNVVSSLGLNEIDEISLNKKFQNAFLSELRNFRSKFKLIHLPYDDIDIKQVLEWRDVLAPPFSSKKPNEYSDAMARSALIKFTNTTGYRVAVISGDRDWSNVCKLHDELDYFNSISELVELHLNNKIASDKIKYLLLDDDIFDNRVLSDFGKSHFKIIRGQDGRVEFMAIKSILERKLSVVEIDSDEVNIVFSYVVEVESQSTYTDRNSANSDSNGIPIPYPVLLKQTSHVNVSGVCALNAACIASDIVEIMGLELDQTTYALY